MTEPSDHDRPTAGPLIIPVFLPQAGCPGRCVFCNQASITGTPSSASLVDHLNTQVRSYLAFSKKDRRSRQISFYGGNFLGLKKETVLTLLNEAEKFVLAKKVSSLRFSTRPDTINDNRLDIIRPFSVSTIEIGAQSMNDRVLALSKRGHDSTDVIKAVDRLKRRHYRIGLQMMTGLPGDDDAGALRTGEQIAELCPDFVRIYPTLVLADSPLEVMYQKGDYRPSDLTSAVDLVKTLYLQFEQNRIPVIRMGLQASADPDQGLSITAGPYHPAFGHLVHGNLFLDKAVNLLKSKPFNRNKTVIWVHPRSLSKMQGLKKNNIQVLKNVFALQTLSLQTDPQLELNQLRIA